MTLPLWIQEHDDGIMLMVRVQPRASHAGFRDDVGGRLKVRLNSPPAEGKANRELVELVAKRLGIAKSSVYLVKGEKGKEKNLLCKGVTINRAIASLRG